MSFIENETFSATPSLAIAIQKTLQIDIRAEIIKFEFNIRSSTTTHYKSTISRSIYSTFYKINRMYLSLK